MPADNIFSFTSDFIDFKSRFVGGRRDIALRKEKKGKDVFTGKLFTTTSSTTRKRVISSFKELIRSLRAHKGKIYYQGLQKYADETKKHNANNLMRSQAQKAVKISHRMAIKHGQAVSWVFDQHSSHKHWMVAPDTDDFGKDRLTIERERLARIARMYHDMSARHHALAPPFQTDSKLSYAVEAADWICTVLAKSYYYAMRPDLKPEFEEYWRTMYPLLRPAVADTAKMKLVEIETTLPTFQLQ